MINALAQPPNLGAGAGTVGGLGTTSKIFSYNSTLNASLVGLAYALPIAARYDGLSFSVRAGGKIFANQALNMTVTFFGITGALPALANQLTPGSYTILGASTARASGGQLNTNFTSQLDLFFDSTSGKLAGRFSHTVNNAFDAPAALTNQLTAILANAEPSFNIVVGVTFSVTDALNLSTLTEFGEVPS